MLKIDLGSGGCRMEGFLSVDRFPLENVDVVADLDGVLPFDTSSVDLLYASHSLEHVHDLMHTMREIYRVCKHGAQICIVAPYYEQKLNFANPYHLCVFNEHTPRFWTDYPEVNIDSAEFSHPHAPHWGLSRSDHSSPDLDLRLVNMEFFYFPEYRYLSKHEQLQARRAYVDVCDQIMYHLLVWKPENDAAHAEFKHLLQTFVPFEPEYVKKRKLEEMQLANTLYASNHIINNDQSVILEQENKRLSEDLIKINIAKNNLDKELINIRFQAKEQEIRIIHLYDQLLSSTTKGSELSQEALVLKSQIAEQKSNIEIIKNELSASILQRENLNNELKAQQNQVELLQCSFQEQRVVAEDYKARLVAIESEAAIAMQSWAQLSSNMPCSDFFAIDGEWSSVKGVVTDLHSQIAATPLSKGARFRSIFGKNSSLWNYLRPEFDDLKSFSRLFYQVKSTPCLVLGSDISQVPYREYINLDACNSISEICLAMKLLLPTQLGLIGIEVLSAHSMIVANVFYEVKNIDFSAPVIFKFDNPLALLEKGWSLRVYTRDVDVPLALFEVISYRGFKRHINYKPLLRLV